MNLVESSVQDANDAFRNQNYSLALSLYLKFLDQYPELVSLFSYNVNFCKYKLGIVSELSLYQSNVIEANSFDSEYYLVQNPDVAESGMNPEEHYYMFGEKEGRQPNSNFNPSHYYNVNSDVRCAGISAFGHYINNGYKEGRQAKKSLEMVDFVKSSTKPLLFVGHDGLEAGAQFVLLEIVKWFYFHTNKRVKVLLLSYGPLNAEFAKYSEFYSLHEFNIDNSDKLLSFLNEDFEMVFLNTVVSGKFFSYINLLNVKFNCPYVAYIHEMHKVIQTYKSEMDLLQKNQINLWISASPATSRDLVDKYGVDSKKIRTISAFIKPVVERFADVSVLKAETRIMLGIPRNDFVVVGCGSIYWRKGPDLFIDTARTIIKKDKNFTFFWIGKGSDREKLETTLSGDERRKIKFLGHRSNARELFAAADLFFLSSREDPFPLVVLEAAQFGIPTICFKESTGIVEFIKQDAGICLDEISTKEASLKILELSQNQALLKQLGSTARSRVFEQYTSAQKLLDIFVALKESECYKPSVSVVVPFYNQEKYLDERMLSILNQRIRDIEILTFDDCSEDDSYGVVSKYLSDPRVSLLRNETNSGTPFKQWAYGIEKAKGDIVWIAEGDDTCELNFLDTLLPQFLDRSVNIAFARVEMIDEKSNIKKGAFDAYLNKLIPGKFLYSYLNTGQKEVQEVLASCCTLINASGLLIRRSSFGQQLLLAVNYKMCGDWLIYLECLKGGGKIAYCNNTVNYFRRHSLSQVNKIEGTAVYFKERFMISKYVVENFNINKSTLSKMFNEVDYEWDRFEYKRPSGELIQYYDKKFLSLTVANQHKELSVLIVISDLSPGGGQMFAIRLANEIAHQSGKAVLFSVDKFPPNPKVLEKIDDRVIIKTSSESSMMDVVEEFDINVIHSSIWWADKYVYENLPFLLRDIKWLVTMHGCYESLMCDVEIDSSFEVIFRNMLHLVDGWAYLTDKNKGVFERFGYPHNLRQIYNGYRPDILTGMGRLDLGIDEDSFVFCLGSRAIRSKGWLVAVEAVKNIRRKGFKVELLLLGEGELMKELMNNKDPHIHILGQVSNMADFIALSDIALLPTTFVGESMPLVLIEYMSLGKPIITTNVGEISKMVCDEHGTGALVLEVNDDLANNLELSMIRLIEDVSLRESLAYHSKRCFNKFDMNTMMSKYYSMYKSL